MTNNLPTTTQNAITKFIETTGHLSPNQTAIINTLQDRGPLNDTQIIKAVKMYEGVTMRTRRACFEIELAPLIREGIIRTTWSEAEKKPYYSLKA